MELEPNDHRGIARRLDLLHFQEEAPGMVLWHPRGLALCRAPEEAQRTQVLRERIRGAAAHVAASEVGLLPLAPPPTHPSPAWTTLPS